MSWWQGPTYRGLFHRSSQNVFLLLLQSRCHKFDWDERARSLKFSASLFGIPARVRTGYLTKHHPYTKQVEGILGSLLVCWLCVWGLGRWGDALVFVCSSEFTHRGVVCATFGSRMKLCYNASTNLNPTSRPRVLQKNFKSEENTAEWNPSLDSADPSWVCGSWVLLMDWRLLACLPAVQKCVSCRSPCYWQPQSLIQSSASWTEYLNS